MAKIILALVLAFVAFTVWLMHTEDRAHREHEEWLRGERIANEPHPDF